jgi:hypothetical protein
MNNDIEKAIEFYKAKSYEEGGIRDRYTRLAIEALEKQMPKKPINDGSNIRYTPVYSCPKCENRITGTGIANYCYHCGQKLDWR